MTAEAAPAFRPTLEVIDLRTHFLTRAGVVKAVDGVSFAVAPGEVLGLVGESGCGKSMTGFSIIGLVDPPGRVVAGAVRFKGRDLVGLAEEELRMLRGNRIAMIFQDPMMALNPVLRIDTQMVETIQAHRDCTRSAALGLARDALVQMGISSPERRLRCYPHELSGGMRQRIAIAIAFVNEPDLVIADEPTTALDVTIQAQILHEAQELCRRNHTAMIWITHDLAVVSSLADRVAVMYAGSIVEQGNARDLISAPLHPYTKGLLGSVPSANRPGTRLTQIPGTMPSLLDPMPGCQFRTRCPRTAPECSNMPSISSPILHREVRCWRPLAAEHVA
jgi:peptide/nickel transport system ATP-binding protein